MVPARGRGGAIVENTQADVHFQAACNFLSEYVGNHVSQHRPGHEKSVEMSGYSQIRDQDKRGSRDYGQDRTRAGASAMVIP